MALLTVLKKLVGQQNRPQNHVGRETGKGRASRQRLLLLRILLRTVAMQVTVRSATARLESQSWPQNHAESQAQSLVQSASGRRWRLRLWAHGSWEKELRLYCVFYCMCWHYKSLFHSLGFNFYLYLRIKSEPLKSGPKHQNYHQFHEKSSKWPIWLLIGHLGENSYFVGTVHTDSRIRRNGYFGLTTPVFWING
jgi:hypothetical protein